MSEFIGIIIGTILKLLLIGYLVYSLTHRWEAVILAYYFLPNSDLKK